MKVTYTFTQEEINAAKAYHKRTKEAARMSRSSYNSEDAKALYLKAEGAEQVLILLGIYKQREEA